jgi:hypothetical protein
MFKNGIKHEFSRRYPFSDWRKSSKILGLLDIENCDELMYKEIDKGLPLLVGRLGGTEARFISAYLKNFSPNYISRFLPLRKLNENNLEKRKNEVQVNAGFFYDDNNKALNFVESYVDCLINTDILGGWGYAFTWPETFALANQFLKVINKEFTAPWVERHEIKKSSNSEIPWSGVFENKKILVISPFSKSIISQHKIIKKVFPTVYYPKFSLQTITAPLTSGLLGSSKIPWSELLKDMQIEIESRDFDVALLSCGSYAYPLANHVKKLGKIGIHSGGALQLFFGIMGNRWNSSPHITKFKNSYWIRPSSEETPNGANMIEGACYW